MARTILVVDDEPTLREALVDALETDGFRVVAAADGREALNQFRAERPDLVLLDLMLPELSGIEVCRIIRAESGVPIVMLTAKDSELDKVVGLELGADDYVTKPFDLEELLARIKVVLRRARPSIAQVTLGAVTIDFHALRATQGTEEIHLSYREFDVLRYLAEREGRVVSRNELLSQIWSYAEMPITRSVDHAIARLRKKIEPDPRRPRFIHTVHGDGYCLTPEGRAEY
jgi:DNA-binding response OmpR family regulator